jgi:hypothetical protein
VDVAAFRDRIKRQTNAERLEMYKTLKHKRILEAREDPASFVEHCFTNDKNGRPLKNADFHREWQAFFSDTRYGVIEAAVEHGKSIQIGVGRVIWEIGKNPNIRIVLIGANEDAAKKLLNRIRRELDRNQRIQEVFPGLQRSELKGDPWSDYNLTVSRSRVMTDPTIQARSVGSRNFNGSRSDLVIVDDLLNFDNTHSALVRDKLEVWFDEILFTRVQDDYELKEFGRIFFVGNPWDADDQIQRLKRRKAWRHMTTSAVENPDDPPSQWRSTWPAQWPLQRLFDKRDGMADTAHSFARKYLCKILSDSLRRFRKGWIDHMFTLGKDRKLLDVQPRSRGVLLRCFTGVDFGIGKKDSAALTVFFTIAIDKRTKRRIVVGCESGRWTGPEILQKAKEISMKYDSQLCTESNAAQKWMGEFAQEYEGLPVRQLHTGKNKWSEEFGVESIAVEMKSGLWVAPSGERCEERPRELQEWAREMTDYDPNAHTGDRLMASWKAREGARLWSKPRSSRSAHTER